jgi:3'-phosphoadenosine 5'-phosphosulfate sulfotransferase (PAPS reductase)/FAD synthetase
MIAARRLPIDVFTLDTGLLFPETYVLWKRLEALYGLTIRGVQPEPRRSEGASLPFRQSSLIFPSKKFSSSFSSGISTHPAARIGARAARGSRT